jgi:prepilin-type N-terminal cleavage/methylation domain-containing protein
MRSTTGTTAPGFTLPELLIALAVLAVLLALAAPALRRGTDAAHVRGARTEAVATLAVARQVAIARGTRSTLRIDTARARLLVLAAAETVLVRDLRGAHGIRLAATRLELRYSPNGLGYGASNARLIVGRGASADTVVVSRLGRVRH